MCTKIIIVFTWQISEYFIWIKITSTTKFNLKFILIVCTYISDGAHGAQRDGSHNGAHVSNTPQHSAFSCQWRKYMTIIIILNIDLEPIHTTSIRVFLRTKRWIKFNVNVYWLIRCERAFTVRFIHTHPFYCVHFHSVWISMNEYKIMRWIKLIC